MNENLLFQDDDEDEEEEEEEVDVESVEHSENDHSVASEYLTVSSDQQDSSDWADENDLTAAPAPPVVTNSRRPKRVSVYLQ